MSCCLSGVDLEDDNCQEQVLKALGSQKLQLLFLVAGLQYYDTLQTIDRKQVRQQFEVNALGPLFLVQALQNMLADSAKVSWQSKAICQRLTFTIDTGVIAGSAASK